MIGSLIKDLQNEKTKRKIEEYMLRPVLQYVLNFFAPYFFVLTTLLVVIVVLLLTLLYKYK